MKLSIAPKQIVLVGAGHTHVAAIPEIASAARRTDSRITLVCGDPQTPYSGFLPGVISGLVPQRKMMIDVAKLARKSGVELEQQNIAAIEPDLRQIILESGARMRYDVLSVNIGGSCEGMIAEEGGDMMPVKPVLPFIEWLDGWGNDEQTTCAVVGAGVSGVEIALSIDARLRRRGRIGGVYIVGSNMSIIPRRWQLARKVRSLLVQRSISQILGLRAIAAYPGYIRLSDNSEHVADRVIVCTGVRAWRGLADAGFEVDERGFMLVNNRLQSVSHPDVFGCGDCSTVVGGDYPKSGVFALRQAVTLAKNIEAAATGNSLAPWRTKRKTLAIIACGDRSAISHRQGGAALQGRWVLWWKYLLDERFMQGLRN